MYKLLVIYILIAQTLCVSDKTLCDNVCMCKYKDSNDLMHLTVDCSYRDVLNSSFVLPKLTQTLDLSASAIVTVTESNLLKSDSIQNLLLNNNAITRIEVNVLLLPELKQLDLSYNELQFIDPEVFRYTRKLEYLNLASNKFTTFAPKLFLHLNSLQALELDYNDVGKSLREANLFQTNGLGLYKGIKSLSLSSIKLNIFPENFLLQAYDLRSLDISGNKLTLIPELPFTLEKLDLSNNPIKSVDPEDFSELPSLKELKLNNLKISEIPDFVFVTMKALTLLELERNLNLTKFSSLAFGQEVLDDADDFTLESLSLRGSRLTTLSKDLEVPLGQLTKLDLQGNPWRCDCNLVWLKEMQITKKYYEHLRCATPKALFNSKIFELDNKFFTCRTLKRGFVGISITIASVCMFLAGVALWMFLFMPRYNSRFTFLRDLHYPSTNYAVLPINPNEAETRYLNNFS